MSSFNFDDEWDSLELYTPRASPTSGVPGELEILSGGGIKSVSLFYVGELVDVTVCWGLVGSGKAKFCVKPCIAGSLTCGTLKHEGSKFTPTTKTFYIRSGDTQALCIPCLRASEATQRQQELLHSGKQTVAEWVRLFKTVTASTPVRPLIAESGASGVGGLNILDEATKTTKDSLDLQNLDVSTWDKGPVLRTPTLVNKHVGIFEKTPTMPTGQEIYGTEQLAEDQNEWEAKDVPGSLIQFLIQLHNQLALIKEGWPAPFRDIEASFMLMSKDLEEVFESCRRLQRIIGEPESSNDFENMSVWRALEQSADRIRVGMQDIHIMLDQEVEDRINAKMEIVTNLEASYASLVQASITSEQQMKVHSKRFEQIKPFLIEFKRITEQPLARGINMESSMQPLKDELLRLKHQIEQVDRRSRTNQGDDLWFGLSTPATTSPVSQEFDEKLRTMQAQLQLLEKRVVGKGVTMGNYVFQTFDELATWVTLHVPQNRFGLFVDGVSLFEFFSYDHTDTDMFMTTSHNTQKNGFNTLFEARIATSMQNLFPTMFGKASSTGMDSSEFLPALTDPDKWDLNGVTGLKHQIDREILNVDFSIESTINNRLQDYHDARQIARDCLFKAKRFVLELSNFMSQDYAAWKYRGYTKKDVWRITCVSVRRIFEDIHAVRVSARDIRDISDASYNTAQYIWATLKAHEVMEEYMKRQFYEHPSVSAVLARHLASNHLKPDDKIDARVKRLEEDFKKLSVKVDRIESRLSVLEKNGKGGGRPKNLNTIIGGSGCKCDFKQELQS